MKYEMHECKSFCVITPQDKRLDARGAAEFKQSIHSLIAKGHGNLLLDLRNVQFVDSSGLGALVSCLKAARPEGDLQLCSVSPAVLSLLKLTRLDKVFTLHESAETAFS